MSRTPKRSESSLQPPFWWLVAAIVGAGGCGESIPTDPFIGFEQITPQITELRLGVGQPNTFLAPQLFATFAPGHLIRGFEFVSVQVRSSNGTERDVKLITPFCRDVEFRLIACDQVLVTLGDGRTVEDLGPLLRDVDGQFIGFQRIGLQPIHGGTIQLFSGSLQENFTAIVAHDAVESADLNTIAFPGGEPSDSVPATSGAQWAIPTSDIPSRNRIGFPVSVGDSLIATYRQPDGSTLTAVLTIN